MKRRRGRPRIDARDLTDAGIKKREARVKKRRRLMREDLRNGAALLARSGADLNDALLRKFLVRVLGKSVGEVKKIWFGTEW